MQQYAAAAYCPLNINTTGTKVTCSVGNCPLVEAADTKTEVEFINVGKTDVTGFVATDHTNRLVVISFRGSSTLQNWITDGIYSTSDTDICPSCEVHDGFWFSWSEARNRVLAALENTASKNAGYQVVVVGHSLGGAIGVLCAAEMRMKGRNVELYTFGAPRVGSKAFSQFVTDQGSNFRVTHYNDIVPRLPPLEFGNKIRRELSFALSKRGPLGGFGYVHISPEYYIRSGTNVTVKVDDIDTYHGLVSFKGNTGQAVPSVDAHRWYFNAISACG
ncbi:Alpha/Beta hydrolase protein [Clohesyomyces aquaticus]|uniref:Alpha/Beta hydrolase protein n=1 Tax=Clohesyomyces aquaticus TaxID=1231657 RepID=A0A1Y1ZYK8_9PLEO|nr:Alpha/Beta hydrolase protein [Clohesyomyces aquaticus]